MAAIGKGARVVLTSRNYIYRDARPLLKEYAYPRLREQQVIVDVEDLTLDERRQILYNHIPAATSPSTSRPAMKPFLRCGQPPNRSARRWPGDSGSAPSPAAYPHRAWHHRVHDPPPAVPR